MLLLRQVGEKFRNRSLKFPGLISGCTMDWFQRWPKDALIAVSSHFLSQYHIVSEDETKKQLIEMMGTVHDGVAENCITYFQRSVSVHLYKVLLFDNRQDYRRDQSIVCVRLSVCLFIMI